jgi:predicted ATPase/DNA-binding XRE family transcriptional regulator
MTRTPQSPSAVGATLQRLRRRAGLSQQELADRAGLSLRGIADLERGARRSPYPATLRRLTQALELNDADRAALLASAAMDEPRTDPSQDVAARSLPQPLSRFIGREREKAAVQQLVKTARLVTLTGTGGIGKTRLALEVLADNDPVAFVDLAPVADGELVGAAVAKALGIRKQPGVPVETLLTSWLASRTMLLLLDNCEHLLESCAALAEVLLRTCPGLRILATSRERLNVPGEMSWRVPSLPVPGADASMDHIQDCDAVRLFVDRATAVSSGHGPTLTPQHAASVARLVRRLDGIPLAIELAAARVNVLSVEQIADRLDDAVRLLVGGSRLAPARQQTLQATFEWSYSLLSDAEQRLFARLSVFSGGWTLGAAEGVCGEAVSVNAIHAPLARERILDLLARLIDKSLVLAEPTATGELRYQLLEPMRQFAAECLVRQGTAAVLGKRHAHWFAALVAEAAAQFHGPSEVAALERIDREYANIQAAFDSLLLDQPTRRGDAVRLAHGLWWFWAARDHWIEASSRLNRLVDSVHFDDDQGPELDLLWMAGSIAWMRGDLTLANRWIDQCVTLARQRNQTAVLARVLGIAAQLAAARGEYALARQLSQEGLPLVRETGPRWSEARYLDGLALLAIEQGDLEEAAKCLTSSLELARATGDAWSEAAALNKLGDVARAQSDYARAGRLYEESLLLLEGQGDELRASVLHNLGYVATAQGDQARASALFSQSMRLCHARGEQHGVAECLVGFACLAAAKKQRLRAARLFGAADAAFQSLGTALSPSNRLDARRGLETARRGVLEAFTRAYADGQALSLEAAVLVALPGEASRQPGRQALATAE